MNSHQRRTARRNLLRHGSVLPIHLVAMSAIAAPIVPPAPVPPPPPFAVDEKVRIVSESYGKSYNRMLGMVAGCNGDTVSVIVKKRKTPLEVSRHDLEKAA